MVNYAWYTPSPSIAVWWINLSDKSNITGGSKATPTYSVLFIRFHASCLINWLINPSTTNGSLTIASRQHKNPRKPCRLSSSQLVLREVSINYAVAAPHKCFNTIQVIWWSIWIWTMYNKGYTRYGWSFCLLRCDPRYCSAFPSQIYTFGLSCTAYFCSEPLSSFCYIFTLTCNPGCADFQTSSYLPVRFVGRTSSVTYSWRQTEE